MLRFVPCLLLAATTLAAQRGPYVGIHRHTKPQNYHSSRAVYPIDYNDDLTITNPQVQPDTNIVFTFSQARRDQPLQVDTREEKLGRYFYRHPSSTTTTTTTTTTTAAPEVTSIKKELEVSDESNSESTEVEQTRSQHLEDKPIRPVMLPTGTTAEIYIPSFHGFSSDLEIPDSSRIDPAARYPPVDIWPRTQPTTTVKVDDPKTQATKQTSTTVEEKPVTIQALATEKAPRKHTSHRKSHKHHSRTSDPIVVKEEPVSTTESRATEAPVTTQAAPHRSRHANRGHHKFNINDLMMNAAQPTPSTSVAPVVPAVSPNSLPKNLSGQPSPVPTLSTWFGDNFGK